MAEEKFDPKKSKLIQHAKRELELAGIGDSDSDYGGMLADAALELVTAFARQRHSGASAELTKQLFNRLVSFEELSPITDDPKEWESVSAEMGEPMWQNQRNPAYLSTDGGKTYFHAVTKKLSTSKKHEAKKAS